MGLEPLAFERQSPDHTGTSIAPCYCAHARQKRRGKRFRSVLAEIAGQKLGGPPHRASDPFFFQTKESLRRFSQQYSWKVVNRQQQWSATDPGRARGPRHLDNSPSDPRLPELSPQEPEYPPDSKDLPPTASSSLRSVANSASPVPTQQPLARQTALRGTHPQTSLLESLPDLPAGGMPSTTRATAASSIPAPINRESRSHISAAASSRRPPLLADAQPPPPHAAEPIAPCYASDACSVRFPARSAASDRSASADYRIRPLLPRQQRPTPIARSRSLPSTCPYPAQYRQRTKHPVASRTQARVGRHG